MERFECDQRKREGVIHHAEISSEKRHMKTFETAVKSRHKPLLSGRLATMWCLFLKVHPIIF